jgi:hypothetical protein
MIFDISTILNIVAILIIFYCLYLVVSLRPSIPGGVVGKHWNFLSTLVLLFSLAYLATPFFGLIPIEIRRVFVSFIFLAGAVYVLITVRLIFNIIRELTE